MLGLGIAGWVCLGCYFGCGVCCGLLFVGCCALGFVPVGFGWLVVVWRFTSMLGCFYSGFFEADYCRAWILLGRSGWVQFVFGLRVLRWCLCLELVCA